jgi:hypothetical protein
MHRESKIENRSGLLFTLILMGLVTALAVIPAQFPSEAGTKQASGLFPRTVSHEDGLDFYDIRTVESIDAREAFTQFRHSAGKNASLVADEREKFVRAEETLRTSVPTLKVEYNQDLRIPETIGPDVNNVRTFLTQPSNAKRSDLLRSFIRQNNDLVGMSDDQVDDLEVQADYTNPDGNLSYVVLEQTINGIPVSRGEVKAGFTKNGEIIRVINNLAPGLDYGSLSTDFDDPANAVRNAARHINHDVRSWETTLNPARSTDLKVTFGTELYATTAEKLYFPTEPGVAVPAWRVTIWKDVPAYEITVDAATGTLLRRENIVKDQTQSVTYNVWSNTTSALKAHDNPAPLTPGPIDPSLGTQGTNTARTMVTLIGNEAPYAFNNNGWITDGANTTSGNNVNAGLDRGNPNGVDAPTTGSGMRVFDFASNPPPGNPAPGDDPLPAGEAITPCPASPNATVNPSQHAAVTQMFYVVNRLHDETYRRGFTEQARNFQVDNFGRGGTGGDPVQAEGQDCSGSNNANMASSSTDGSVGRMQMYLWTAPTPDRDGTMDAEIIVHEIGHGIMNRLHTLGTAGTQGGQMHEGSGDFLAHLLLSEASDPINGIYTTGGYSTLNLRAGAPFLNVGNYYYGIRRFPKAVIAFTGGPMNRPHNPLTYGDIDPAQINVTDGAFAAAFPGTATAVHDGGEIWSSMLWEVRALVVARLGHEAGTAKMLQLQLDGMKLVGATPSMLSERNAIIAGALAVTEPGPDAADVREGFRRRGMGFSAANPTGNTVVEAFDFPNVQMIDPFTVSDAPGDNDGFPEPGENLLLNISVTNPGSGSTITNVQVNVNGGPNVSFGDIANGATVAMNVPYTVPGDAVCGSLHPVTINVTSSVGAQTPAMRAFRLGVPVGGPPVSFENTTAITIPSSGPGTPSPSTISVSGVTGNKAVKLTLNGLVHPFPDDVDFMVQGPNGGTLIFLSDAGGTNDWAGDNVTLTDLATDLASDSGAIPTGEYKPTNYGANDPFDPPAPAGPYGNPAPAGTDTFESVFGTAGSGLNGDWKLYLDDDLAGFSGTVGGGWKITFESNDYTCSIGPPLTPEGSRADFDGDGRTDLSVFRPSEGNWYINRSTAGFVVLNWGISTDRLVPGDFDGDGKTDTAVFRPTADPSQPDFYILNSNGFTVSGVSWGVSGDVPVVGDYDDDGETDVAVFRPSDNTWYILNSGGGTNIRAYGIAGDIPVPADFIGDASTDIAVFRPSTNSYWIFNGSGDTVIPFGAAGDFLVPADYDGDNKDDIAVFRPSTGQWIYIPSSGGPTVFRAWGAAGDIPVPGDYDGDGTDDLAIYRNGAWWLNSSTSGVSVQNFGISTDLAIPRQYLP